MIEREYQAVLVLARNRGSLNEWEQRFAASMERLAIRGHALSPRQHQHLMTLAARYDSSFVEDMPPTPRQFAEAAQAGSQPQHRPIQNPAQHGLDAQAARDLALLREWRRRLNVTDLWMVDDVLSAIEAGEVLDANTVQRIKAVAWKMRVG